MKMRMVGFGERVDWGKAVGMRFRVVVGLWMLVCPDSVTADEIFRGLRAHGRLRW
jgi:hypothetical protein